DQIAEQYPEFIKDLQERLGRRLLLMAEAEAIRQQAAHGTLAPALAEQMTEEIAREMRSLRGYDLATLRLEPMDILGKVPAFQNLSQDDLSNIAIRMQFRNVAAGEIITRQGERSGSMVFITPGVIRLSRQEDGVSQGIATAIRGDFFGEWALLEGQPDRVTATAVSPCSLYSLHRDDLEVAMAMQPAIRRVLEREPELKSDALRNV